MLFDSKNIKQQFYQSRKISPLLQNFIFGQYLMPNDGMAMRTMPMVNQCIWILAVATAPIHLFGELPNRDLVFGNDMGQYVLVACEFMIFHKTLGSPPLDERAPMSEGDDS